MHTFTAIRKWSLTKVQHEIRFRKPVPLTPYDLVFLKMLSLHGGTIKKKQFGLLLGFGTKNDEALKIYEDAAEIQIFDYLLNELKKYSLILETENKEYLQLAYWGEKALETKLKYTFHEGLYPIYDHLYLNYEESYNNFFPFNKFHLKFNIDNESKIEAYSLKGQINKNSDFLLKKIVSNNEQITAKIIIDEINPISQNFEEITTLITATLIDETADYRIETSVNEIPLPELDKHLEHPSNKDLYDDLLLYVECQYLIKTASSLKVNELTKYKGYIDWNNILSDVRIEWTEKLFELLADPTISSGSIWFEVVKHCPPDILKAIIRFYSNYFNWSILTEGIDTEYIIDTFSIHPWDIEIFLKKANSEQIETFLTSKNYDVNNLNWLYVSKKLSDNFILENISSFDFDFRFITKDRQSFCEGLILNYPNKKWNWQVISTNYDLSFLLANASLISKYLHLPLIIPRLLNANDQVFDSFQRNSIFKALFETFALSGKKDFSINADSKVFLDKKRLEFLDKYQIAFWGVDKIAGIEANPKLVWHEEIFKFFKSKVKSKQGKKRVSETIPSIEIIKENPNFEWDFHILSGRLEFIDDIDLIKKYKDDLSYYQLINSIRLDLLQNELLFFLEWSNEIGQSTIFVNCIQNRFSFHQILNLISIFGLYDLNFGWETFVSRSTVQEFQKAHIIHQKTINKLPNHSSLIEIITKKIDLDFVLRNTDLRWDWKEITRSKFNSKQLKNEFFLSKYTSELFWDYIIQEVFTVEDLISNGRLNEIADYLTNISEEDQKKAWHIITKKLPTNYLWSELNRTLGVEKYRWDWDYISSDSLIIENFSFDNLIKLEKFINWNILSNNIRLNDIWKYSKNYFRSYFDWKNYVLGYLVKFKKKWNFKFLSNIGSITWNSSIINQFENEWDWDVLTRDSNLITEKKENRIFLKWETLSKYIEKINWKILSTRYEITIPEKSLRSFLDQDWDFQALSDHPNLFLSIKILQETSTKNWDWKTLTRRSDIGLNKDLLLAQKVTNERIEQVDEWEWIRNRNWDWEYLSNAKWLDAELLDELHDKGWNWEIISKNNSIIFDQNLIELLTRKDYISWTSIIQNPKTHLNYETLKLIEQFAIFSKEDWNTISSHINLTFIRLNTDNKSSINWNFLDRYIEHWNWKKLVSEKKIDISNINILRRYRKQLDWNQISGLKSFKPKIEILEEFKDLINWNILSDCIPLTGEILNKFESYLDWRSISKNTSIYFSPDMLYKYEKKWDYYLLKENTAIKRSEKANKALDKLLSQKKELQLYFKLQDTESYSPWAGNVYHFTHISNAIKIINSRKILSRNKAHDFADAAGSVVGRRHSAHDFARFYFRPQTPTQFYNECLGKDITNEKHYDRAWALGLPKCPIPVFFKFNLQEILLNIPGKCFASIGNMQTNWAKYYPVSKVSSYFNFKDVYSTIDNTSNDNYRTYINFSQQEFLVKDIFDFSSLSNFQIIVRTEEDRKQLLSLIDQSESIKNKVFLDNHRYRVFHNKNCEISYSFDGNKLSLKSDYKGNGFSKGSFVIEFEENTNYMIEKGKVIQKKKNKIFAYPSIEFLFEKSPSFLVKFIDESNRSWNIIDYNFIKKSNA